jgi:hypothetical protein
MKIYPENEETEGDPSPPPLNEKMKEKTFYNLIARIVQL